MFIFCIYKALIEVAVEFLFLCTVFCNLSTACLSNTELALVSLSGKGEVLGLSKAVD